MPLPTDCNIDHVIQVMHRLVEELPLRSIIKWKVRVAELEAQKLQDEIVLSKHKKDVLHLQLRLATQHASQTPRYNSHSGTTRLTTSSGR